MDQAKSHVVPKEKQKVYMIVKSLFGLKQVPK